MNKLKPISGYCPVREQEVIEEFVCISDGNGKYLKGTFHCSHIKNGGQCAFSPCPIWEKHPKEFF